MTDVSPRFTVILWIDEGGVQENAHYCEDIQPAGLGYSIIKPSLELSRRPTLGVVGLLCSASIHDGVGRPL